MKIRLKKSLCPEEKLSKESNQFGSLNYFVLFLNKDYTVLGEEINEYNNKPVLIAKNPHFSEPLYFMKEDCEIIED